MDKTLPFVSVVLPVFNEERYLESCLKTLKQIEYPKDKYEIITVDNGSTDHSLHIARQHADQALLLPNANVGAVRNFGVKHSKGEILVFLDSDCLVPGDWLHQGINLLFTEKKCVYGGSLNLRKNPYWIERFWLLDNYKDDAPQHDLLGSCIFIQKKAFLDAGQFKENITSGEDSTLSNTLLTLGYKITIDSRLSVVHLGNPTTIASFITRQIWHSENYVKEIRKSLKDKVFWLIIIYFLSLLGLFLSIFIAPDIAAFFIVAIIFPPTILSAKRIIRANYHPITISSLISIFIIDNLYLVGRTLGILKGVYKVTTRHLNIEIFQLKN